MAFEVTSPLVIHICSVTPRYHTLRILATIDTAYAEGVRGCKELIGVVLGLPDKGFNTQRRAIKIPMKGVQKLGPYQLKGTEREVVLPPSLIFWVHLQS